MATGWLAAGVIFIRRRLHAGKEPVTRPAAQARTMAPYHAFQAAA
jgi:hypothetical protein